jgi:hypothetical protein
MTALTTAPAPAPGIPDGYQVLKENAPSFALDGGGFYIAFAPVINARTNAASAVDSALGTVATGAGAAAAQLVPTEEQTAGAAAGAAVASIGRGFRGSFGP